MRKALQEPKSEPEDTEGFGLTKQGSSCSKRDTASTKSRACGNRKAAEGGWVGGGLRDQLKDLYACI